MAWHAGASFRVFVPTARLPYLALLASLLGLWRQHADLRCAMLAQGLLSLGFSAFWSTSSVVLHAAPFCLGSICAGAFGLAGAARALGAPAAGRVADKHGPELVTRLGAGLAAAAFGALLLSSLLDSYAQLALIPAWRGCLRPWRAGFPCGTPNDYLQHRSGRSQPEQCGVVRWNVRGYAIGGSARECAAGTLRLGGRLDFGARQRVGRTSCTPMAPRPPLNWDGIRSPAATWTQGLPNTRRLRTVFPVVLLKAIHSQLRTRQGGPITYWQ